MYSEQLGPFCLTLPDGCFPLVEDSLALGGFASLRPRWRVCDLGCGGGTLLLLLVRREASLSLTGVELDPDAAEAARDNLTRNRLTGTIITGDLRRSGLPNEEFDLVISNPPWFAVGAGASGGTARSEQSCSLEEFCTAANRLLRTGGRLALVHRPERLTDLLCILRTCRLEPKRLQFLAHDPSALPSAVLVEAVKNGRPGLEALPTAYRDRP